MITRGDRLLFRGMLSYSALLLLLLVALIFFAQVIAKASGPGHGPWSMQQLLLYVTLQMPQVAYDVIPLALLLGALAWLTSLTSHSELIALRMSGWSVTRLERPLLAVGVLGALLVFALGEWVVPITAPAAEAIWANASAPGVGFHDLGPAGLWLRDGRQIVRIAAVGDDGRRLRGISIATVEPAMVGIDTMMTAREARFANGRWTLVGVQSYRIGTERIIMGSAAQSPWQVALKPATLQSFSHRTRTMTLPALWQAYRALQGSALTMNRFALAFWQRLSYPFVGLVMILLAVPFAIRSHRGGGLAGRILLGLTVGLAFHFLNLMSGYISVSGGLPPAAATLAPLGAFALLAWWLHTRTT